MRERAAMMGGSLVCGRSAGGGFVVEAVLPLPPDEP
jgi:signal transduction histidine kinase